MFPHLTVRQNLEFPLKSKVRDHSPDEIAAAVNEVLDRVPDEAPLVWVDTYFRDRPEQQELVNSIIRDRVERRGNSVIAPWSAFAPEDGVLTSEEKKQLDELVLADGKLTLEERKAIDRLLGMIARGELEMGD